MLIKGIGGQSDYYGVAKSALTKSNSELKKVLERLSTLQRINRASDDAAGLAISEELRTNIRGYKMASRNVEDATAELNIAEGAANEVSSLLQRQRELTIQASNSTLTDTEREYLNREFQSVTNEIQRLSESTKYNKQNTSNGTDLGSGNASIQVGPDAGETITLPEVNITEVYNKVNTLSIDTETNARSALQTIDEALNVLNEQRTNIGATVNRLYSTSNNISVAMVNTQAAESLIRDEDVAMGLAELTRQKLLQEGTLSTLNKFNELNRKHIAGLLFG